MAGVVEPGRFLVQDPAHPNDFLDDFLETPRSFRGNSGPRH